MVDDATGEENGPKGQTTGKTDSFQKMAEAVLTESRENFKILFDELNDGILVADAATKRLVMANSKICRMLGYSRAELLTLTVPDIHPRPDLPQVLTSFEKQRRKEVRMVESQPVLRKDGSVFYADISSSPISRGTQTLVAGIFRDVTVKKTEAEQLRASEEQLRSLVADAANFCVYRLVPDASSPHELRVAFASPSIKDIMGTSSPMQFETWFDNIHPDDKDRVIRANLDAFNTLRFDEEFRTYNPNTGAWQWVHALATGVMDRNGRLESVNGILADVTDKYRLHEKLLKSQAHLQSLMDSASGFVIYRMAVDGQAPYHLNMTAVSPSVKEILGVPPEKFTAGSYYDNLHPEDAADVMAAHKAAFQTGKFEQVARVYNPEKADYVWIHAISIAVKNRQGQMTNVNGIFVDVTEKQNAFQELEKVNGALSVLIDRRDRVTLGQEERIKKNIEEGLLPEIEKLKTGGLTPRQAGLVEMIEQGLKDITSDFLLNLSLAHTDLTPSERKVALYIKQGRSSKEIAGCLNISIKTVKNHRMEIRKKLGLVGKGVRLYSHLSTLK